MGTISDETKLGIITLVDEKYNYVWTAGMEGLELRFRHNPGVTFECGEIVRFIQSHPTKGIQIVHNLMKSKDSLSIENDPKVTWKVKVLLTFAPKEVLDEYKKGNGRKRITALAYNNSFELVASYVDQVKYVPGVVYEAYISRIPKGHETLAEKDGTVFLVIGGKIEKFPRATTYQIDEIMQKCPWKDKVMPPKILVPTDRIANRILACRCQAFAGMFHSGMVEAQNNRIEIEDVNSEVLEQMLHFIYAGTVPKIEKLAKELLVAADKYQLDRLKLICEREIANSLDIENACEILILADFYGAEQLKAHAVYFIRNNENVKESEDWEMLSEELRKLIDGL